MTGVRKILQEFSGFIGYDICSSPLYKKPKLNQLLEAYAVYHDGLEEYEFIDLCTQLGRIYTSQGEEQHAFDFFNQGMMLAKEKESYQQQAILYRYIATTYQRLGSYQEALKNFHCERNCYHKLDKDNDEIVERTLLLNINLGLSYCGVGRYEMAFMYLKITDEKRFLKITDKYRILINALRIKTYFGMKDIERVIFYTNQFLNDSKNHRVNEYFMEYKDLFFLLLSSKRQIEARDFLIILIEIAEDTGNEIYEIECADAEIQYCKQFGDKSSYLSALKEYMQKSMRQVDVLKAQKQLRILNRNELSRTQMENNRLLKTIQILKERSEHDELTKLPNRYRLYDYAKDKFQEAIQLKLPFGIDIIDVDYFKQYNDNFGHLSGDMCLVMIADILRESAAPHFVARFGGDEFFIIFFGASTEQVKETVERIQSSLEEKRIEQAENLPYDRVTLSHGLINRIPEEGQSLVNFIKMADDALSLGKKLSRNTIYYDSELYIS